MKIEDYIFLGKYKEAASMCDHLDSRNIIDVFLRIAFESENISIFTFAQYMFEKTDEECWSELMIEIMIHPLCFVEGAYSVALFYARKAIEKEKNARNLERILFFYEVPEKLVSYEEACAISKELLQIEPDNKLVVSLNLNMKLADIA